MTPKAQRRDGVRADETCPTQHEHPQRFRCGVRPLPE